MTNHRAFQLINLADICAAEARVCARCAIKAQTINNRGAERHFSERATRLALIAARASIRVAA